MIVSNVNAKLIGLQTYFKKDEKGQKTSELGYMFTLLVDIDSENPLRNSVISPMCSKEFILEGDVDDFSFGDDVLIKIDMPIVKVGAENNMPIRLLGLRGA